MLTKENIIILWHIYYKRKESNTIESTIKNYNWFRHKHKKIRVRKSLLRDLHKINSICIGKVLLYRIHRTHFVWTSKKSFYSRQCISFKFKFVQDFFFCVDLIKLIKFLLISSERQSSLLSILRKKTAATVACLLDEKKVVVAVGQNYIHISVAGVTI